MWSSRKASHSKWESHSNNNKDTVKRARNERSSRQVNKKLVKLLLAEPDDNDATSATSSTATPDSAFFDCHSEEESSGLQEWDLPPGSKCRTCFRIISRDEGVKDLYDRDNMALLHHIKVTTGVWIQQGVKELPHHICATCQETLKKAVEFRGKCQQIDKKLRQTTEKYNFQICDEEMESELENVLYEESVQQAQEVLGPEDFSPELWSESECALDEEDFPLDLESVTRVTQSLSEDDLGLGEDTEKVLALEQKKPSWNEIIGIQKCKTEAEIGKVEYGAKVYKVVLGEYNSQKEAEPKYSLPLPKRPRLRVSPEEKKRRQRERVQAKPFNYVCDKCGHSFRQRIQLQMHLLRHNSAKDFECPECPKKFYDVYTRNIHVRVRHKGEHPFRCNHCNESFSNASSRHRHERNVHGAGNRIRSQKKSREEGASRHYCTKCPKSYTSKNGLALHMNSHNGTRPFQCKNCHRSFADPSAMKRHQALHEKFPFRCDICLKGFLLSSLLTKHLDVHTGKRPHRCELCDVHYRHRYNLNKHKTSKLHRDNVQKAEEEEINRLQYILTDFQSY
ncbi:zinc finger protein 182 [Drosophila santomea]|uniref:zinc finger protein 182 n=1 Tax=Drosophila santomea TaxID=129105 RepID=UPI001954D463|nr:zinc finger protein 182 [Drosophila santomea]